MEIKMILTYRFDALLSTLLSAPGKKNFFSFYKRALLINSNKHKLSTPKREFDARRVLFSIGAHMGISDSANLESRCGAAWSG